MEASPMYYPQPQVQPQVQYVGVGRRFLAFLIDVILLGAINSILLLLFFHVFGVTRGSVVENSVGPIITLAYLFGLEATRGATLGKMLLGLRVVKIDGSPIGWSEAITRNLLGVIDCLFGGLVGAILIWTSPQRQRLGDRAARTVVIRRPS